jgi:hypothetical protein
MTRIQINAAKIGALMAGLILMLGAFAPAASAQTTPFVRDLTVGSRGADVMQLQTWLMARGFSIPAGPTDYFGNQTQAAVAAYQAANGIVPAAGYFGPITRSYVNARLTTTTPPSNNDDGDDDSGSSAGLRGGEASLEKLNARGGDDDQVEEGDTAEVAEFEFDVEDGDIRVDRLDLTFDPAVGNDEDKPWDTFDTITIYDANGKKLASEDVSDKRDWLDDDGPYVFRFTKLNYVVREGKQGKIVVEAEAQNGVVDSGNTDQWTVYIDDRGLRGIDSEGLQQYLGNDNESVTFDVVEEGEGEELNVRNSDEDPDASVLKIEDNKRSDWHTIFAFDLEAEDEDIELDDATIELALTTANAADAINDLELVIDGETVDDWRYETNGNAATVNVIFDIDGDVTIDEGDTATVELRARFNSDGTGTFGNGDRIRARVASGGITGEGRDDVSSNGSATGETHTLSLATVKVSDVKSSTSRSERGNSGTISFDFNVEAKDGDVTFDEVADIVYTVLGPDATIASMQFARISGDASVDAGVWTVEEGDDATFSLDITFTTVDSGDNGTYRVRLERVAGVEVNKTSGSVFLTN